VVVSRRMQALDGLLVVDLTGICRVRSPRASCSGSERGCEVERRVEIRAAQSTEWHELLNAGKESVVCELPRERAFARSLLERADVVLESFRPGVAAQLGIGPDDAARACRCTARSRASGRRSPRTAAGS